MCAFETHVNLSILSFHYAIGILYILLKCVEITLDTQHKTVTVIQLHCIIKGFSQKTALVFLSCEVLVVHISPPHFSGLYMRDFSAVVVIFTNIPIMYVTGASGNLSFSLCLPHDATHKTVLVIVNPFRLSVPLSVFLSLSWTVPKWFDFGA